MPRKPTRIRVNATWRVEKIQTTAGLYRLIGPLAKQNGKVKTICVAIGSKRLREIVPILNELEVEV
jgi:hypothetical protein